MVSLRAGSPLSYVHEPQRAKQYDRKESGEEVPRKCLAASPLYFGLAAMPRACAPILTCAPT